MTTNTAHPMIEWVDMITYRKRMGRYDMTPFKYPILYEFSVFKKEKPLNNVHCTERMGH
jgi:hypothetical protein